MAGLVERAKTGEVVSAERFEPSWLAHESVDGVGPEVIFRTHRVKRTRLNALDRQGEALAAPCQIWVSHLVRVAPPGRSRHDDGAGRKPPALRPAALDAGAHTPIPQLSSSGDQ